MAWFRSSALVLGALGAGSATPARAQQHDVWQGIAGYWSRIRDVALDFDVTHTGPPGIPTVRMHGRWLWRCDGSAGLLDAYYTAPGIGTEGRHLKAFLHPVCRDVRYAPRPDGGASVKCVVYAEPGTFENTPLTPRVFHYLVITPWRDVIRDMADYRMTGSEQTPAGEIRAQLGSPDGVLQADVTFDPTKGWLPVEQVVSFATSPIRQAWRVERSEEVAPGVWYPVHVHCIDTAPFDGGAAEWHTSYLFTGVQVNTDPPDGAFAVELPLGTSVEDTLTGRIYTVGDDAAQVKSGVIGGTGVNLADPRHSDAVAAHLDEAASAARALAPPPNVASEAVTRGQAADPDGVFASLRWAFLGAPIGLVLAGPLVFFVRRRNRDSHRRPVC